MGQKGTKAKTPVVNQTPPTRISNQPLQSQIDTSYKSNSNQRPTNNTEKIEKNISIEKLWKQYETEDDECNDEDFQRLIQDIIVGMNNQSVRDIHPSSTIMKEKNDPDALGIKIELIIAYHADAKSYGVITRPEWNKAMNFFGITLGDIDELRSSVHIAIVDIWGDNNEKFKQLYNFAFDYVGYGNQRTRDVSMANILWKVLLTDKYPLTSMWCSFLEVSKAKGVSKDLWFMWLEFCEYNAVEGMRSYDPNASWPIAIDEFVEHAQFYTLDSLMNLSIRRVADYIHKNVIDECELDKLPVELKSNVLYIRGFKK